jgi:hypothetical protein
MASSLEKEMDNTSRTGAMHTIVITMKRTLSSIFPVADIWFSLPCFFKIFDIIHSPYLKL